MKGLLAYKRNRKSFYRQAACLSTGEFAFHTYPCPADRYEPGGVASGAYFHQDLHVAQLIAKAAPTKHVDVGSRFDGFVTHVASYRQIEVLDIRPLLSTAENVSFIQRDIMRVDEEYDDYTDSLSCLHALEHFGLGRYGDVIDYDGHLKGWANLTRMVKRSGRLYFSVPVSEHPRVEFDAHRVFSLPYLMEILIRDDFEVLSFAFVDDNGDMHRDENPNSPLARVSFRAEYGTAIFELLRRK